MSAEKKPIATVYGFPECDQCRRVEEDLVAQGYRIIIADVESMPEREARYFRDMQNSAAPLVVIGTEIVSPRDVISGKTALTKG